MSDLEILLALPQELADTLKRRQTFSKKELTKDVGKAKIHRLRLLIQEVMLRIERACNTPVGYEYFENKERWHK